MTAITARQRWQRAYSNARYERWPNNVDPVQMAAFRLRYPLFRFFGPAFGRAFSAPFDRNIAATAVPWYLAGGAPTPIAVYEPKGKASLAASYVNLVNPGTYDAAPGTAPTLDASGWVFNGSSQYLTTNYVYSGGAILVAISGATAGSAGRVFGACTGSTKRTEIIPHLSSLSWFFNGSPAAAILGTGVTTGVLGLSERTAYLNGVGSATISTLIGYSEYPMWIGTRNQDGAPGGYYQGKIVAFAIWNTSTNHAVWMPAVSAAAALI